MVYTSNHGGDSSPFYSMPIDQPAVYVGNVAYECGDDAERTQHSSYVLLTSSIYEEPNRT